MPNSKNVHKNEKALKLSKFQREVIVGMLLGDGHLEARGKQQAVRLKIEQSASHQAYVEHLYGLFDDWVLADPHVKVRSTQGRSETSSVSFQTISHSAFRFYYHQFYNAGIKRIPTLIHRWLTPVAIAYWYMDDGSIKSKQSKGVLFNTQSFSKAGVERLIEVLGQKFNLQCSLRKQRSGFQIFVSGKSFETFVELVDEYILDEMRYKIPPPRKTRSMTNKVPKE